MSNDVRDYKKFKGGIRLSKRTSDPTMNQEEGTIIYNSTEQSLKVRNLNGWSTVGGAAGSLDTFYTENFSTTPETDFEVGGALGTGGNIFNLLVSGSNAIDSKSLSFEQLNNPTTGTILLKEDKGIVPTVKQKGNTCSIAFWYTYNGNDDDIKLLVKSTDGSANVTTISSSSDLLKSTSTAKKFVTTFTIPSDSTKIQWGFEIVTGDLGKDLVIDDVEMSQDPFVQADLGIITMDHVSTPSTPASGKVKLYSKNDNSLYIKDSTGTETGFSTPPHSLASSDTTTHQTWARADFAPVIVKAAVRTNNTTYGTTQFVIPFNTSIYDTYTGTNFSTATYNFTAPLPGYYRVTIQLAVFLTTDNDRADLFLYKTPFGGSSTKVVETGQRISEVSSNMFDYSKGEFFLHDIQELSTGDALHAEIKMTYDTSWKFLGNVNTSTADSCTILIERLGGLGT